MIIAENRTPVNRNPQGGRLPPFGVELAARLRWGNPPAAVLVTAGAECWPRAKNPAAKGGDWAPLVLPDGADPAALRWPVAGLPVIIERSEGPGDSAIVGLIEALLRDGAETVAVLWADWREAGCVYGRDGKRRDLTAGEILGALSGGAAR